MHVTFKKVGPAEVDAVLMMMREYYPLDGLTLDEHAARAALHQLVADANLGWAFLVEFEGAVVGYLAVTLGYSLEYHGRDAFLDELFVCASHRGRGIGQEAIAFALETCRQASVSTLHLEVERKNTRAQALYRELGFEDHDRYMMSRSTRATP